MGSKRIPAHLAPYWQRVEAALGPGAGERFYDVSFFDDNQPSADHLASLVLAGRKRATAALAWSFEFDRQAAPAAGALSVITTWSGEPACVIETRSVVTVAFRDVDADFAATEGEGDGSLAHWRQVHWDYFGRECARIGRVPSETMPVVCECFDVVFP